MLPNITGTTETITFPDQIDSRLILQNNAMPLGYYRCTGTQGYELVYVNGKFLDILGYDRNEITELFNDKLSGMIHPDDHGKLGEAREELISGRQTSVCSEYRILGKKGYIWVVDHSTYMGDCCPPFFQGILMDITEKMLLQEQLKASNKAFRIAASEAGNLVFTYSRSRQEIYCEENAARIFNVNETQPGVPYEIIKRNGVISEDTVDDYLRIHEDIIAGKKESGGIVKLLNTPDGERVYEVKFQTILDEKEQPTDLAVGVYKDITATFIQAREQEESIKNLRQEYINVKEEMEKGRRERMAMIYTLSTDYYSLWMLDLDNDILSLRRKDNIFFQESTMPPSCYSESLVRYANSRVHPADREKLITEGALSNIREHLKNDRSFSIRIRRQTSAAEKYKHVEWRIVRLSEEESDRSQNMAIIAVKDVDGDVLAEEKQQELLKAALSQAERANRAKTTFLSCMSHDIRTPMNAIIGFAGIAESNIDNRERVHDCLEKILSSSNHLLSLINDILDMSRIESGKLTLREKECRLSERIHDLVNMILPQMKAKQLNFVADAIDVDDEYLIFDPLKLDQVLINILGNAVKFTPPRGTISFSVRQTKQEKPGSCHFEFIIKDTGIGMSPEFINHIFEPFERESSATESGIAGTGLGMAITKRTIDLMGGSILIDSAAGKGSTFKLGFDFKRPDISDRTSRFDRLKGLRGLIVDDDFEICMSMNKMLKQMGMRSDWTTNGREAIFRAQKAYCDGDPFNFCIIDRFMPNMDGIETTRCLRKAVDDDAPTIILTACDWSDIEEEAKAAGVTAFCSKPLFMSDLCNALQGADKLVSQPVSETDHRIFIGKRVLVVEDNELNREISTETLRLLGFKVETATDGSVAVNMVSASQEGYYDMILMDIQMPIMDGYEATMAIRNLPRRDVVRMPIAAMTANAFEDDKERALQNGMNAHISKPLDIDLLPFTLKKLLTSNPE